jgi:hypothetical protein
MPTDLTAAIQARAARKKQESVLPALLLPLAMCIVTVIAALESPAVTAGFRLYGVF